MSNNQNTTYQEKDDRLDRWRNLTLSTNSTASNQQILSQSEQQQVKKKKKKCRGNRKLQRFRAKLRKQGFNNETIATLINTYNNVINQDQNNKEQLTSSNMDVVLRLKPTTSELQNENVNKTMKSTKRKRETRRSTTGGVTASMSEISLSNLPRKRRQYFTTRHNIIEEQTSTESKPKYLKIPDQIFKEMISKSLVGENNINQLLDTSEKLQFVRIYAHLLNNIFYLKLEQDFWQHYEKLCLSEETIWSSSPLSKEIAKENTLFRFKFKTKIQIEKHRQRILHRLQTAEHKLNQHKQQQSISRSIDMNQLSIVMTAFVRQGQKKLSTEFERKKLILQFDINDHGFVKSFYNLKPTENQVC